MIYYFSGDKSRPASNTELTEIGLDDANIWEGRLVIPIEADTLEDAWTKARAKVAEYEAKTGLRIISLTWSNINHYNV
jgi:hypothetical protein